jgi:UDP-N-acetylglucosamine 2-epimerase (non-hydrolysing)
MKIVLVAGARPNFMKIAPLSSELQKRGIGYTIVHTGQHYDDTMSKTFFKDLQLPQPDIYLGVGSGTHAEQTGKIMIEFERVCFRLKPDLVIVVGDVNSTAASALAAVKLCIPVAHVEAGLRSFDRSMPEEINRILTDQISDYLFTTCEDANRNLRKEGIPASKIFFVGNVMIDTLEQFIDLSRKSSILDKFGLKKNGKLSKYAVLTLHRPSNVDREDVLKGIFSTLNRLSEEIPVIFPAHPRTLERIESFSLDDMVTYFEKLSNEDLKKSEKNVLVMPPMGYIDFLNLMSHSLLVLTDSGGIQEETTILGIPCLTLRDNTERPITVREGTNTLVGNDPERILSASLDILENSPHGKTRPKFWDGKAAGRIVEVLASRLMT